MTDDKNETMTDGTDALLVVNRQLSAATFHGNDTLPVKVRNLHAILALAEVGLEVARVSSDTMAVRPGKPFVPLSIGYDDPPTQCPSPSCDGKPGTLTKCELCLRDRGLLPTEDTTTAPPNATADAAEQFMGRLDYIVDEGRRDALRGIGAILDRTESGEIEQDRADEQIADLLRAARAVAS